MAVVLNAPRITLSGFLIKTEMTNYIRRQEIHETSQ